MMFSSLVMHGLSAFVVCKDIIEKRLRRCAIVITALLLCSVVLMTLFNYGVNGDVALVLILAFQIIGVVVILSALVCWLVISKVAKAFDPKIDEKNVRITREFISIYERQA